MMQILLMSALLGNCECVALGDPAICDCKAIAEATTELLVSAQDPQSIVALLHQHGFEARLEKDEIGDPLIRVAARKQMGSNGASNAFQIRFWHCAAHEACTKMFFQAIYQVDRAAAPTQDKINEWDFNEPVGLAYLDDRGLPSIDLTLATKDGSMSTPHFLEQLETWLDVLERFERHIGYERSTSCK